MLTNFTLVLGGAASGKSAYAEGLVVESERPRVYVATAQAFDDEMRAKIADHQTQRGPDWTTIEAPFDVAKVLTDQSPDGVVLLDCATLWLTNVMLAERDVDKDCDALVEALTNSPCPVVVVSNEVGQGIVPDNTLSRRFRAAQGRLNQHMAAAADRVVFVTAGLPQVLKG